MLHFFERDVRQNCETCGETYLEFLRQIIPISLKKFSLSVIVIKRDLDSIKIGYEGYEGFFHVN